MIITENINVKIPFLYKELIYNAVEEKKFESLSDFIIQAIQEKFHKDRINYKPVEISKDWWDEKDNLKKN